MKPVQHVSSLVAVVASCIAIANELPDAKTKIKVDGVARPPVSAELQLLQGTWKGVEVSNTGASNQPDLLETSENDPTALNSEFWVPDFPGTPQGSQQAITITITGNSLHFHRDSNFWFETTITLPSGTEPKQLHATIRKCPESQAESIGKAVGAIYKLEGRKLTLAAYDISEEPPKALTNAMSFYVVRKTQLPK